MAREPFTIDKLHQIDEGRVSSAIDKGIAVLTRDCMDRPGEGATRTLTIKMEMKPTQSEDGSCEASEVEFTIAAKLPAKRSKVYEMQPRPNGDLNFNAASPDHVHQGTLDEATNAPGVPNAPKGGTEGGAT